MRRQLLLVWTTGLLIAAAAAAQDRPGAKVKLAKDEQALFDLLNKTRAEEKLPPLKLNAVLCEVARQHSKNMAKHEKMAHRLDDKGVGDRVTAAGYDYRSVRENLAKASGDADLPAPEPKEIHKGWLASKGHRANLLNDKVTEVGISMVKSKKGTFYYTQVFGEPRK